MCGEQALSRPTHPHPRHTHTQMGWELVFWNAKSPDSALGILAECVLGNVRPTGNRGVSLRPSCRWAGSRESREYEGTGARVQGAECEGFICTGVRAEGDNCQVKKGVYMCKGGGWGPGCECLKQRVDVQSGWAPCMCMGNVCGEDVCSKERC